MDAIKLTPVEKHLERCPVCDLLGPGFTFNDSDTLSHEPLGRGDYSEYSAHLHEGTCKSCKKPVFMLEVSVLSNPIPDLEFIDDNFFTHEIMQTYHASLPGIQWGLHHYGTVTYDRHPDYTHDWMDRHFIGPFKPNPLNPVARYVYPDPSPGLSASDIARLLLQKLGPQLLALKWP